MLNASRHHSGWYTGIASGPGDSSLWCSTPLGITEVDADSGGKFGRRSSAQRLSASQTWSPPCTTETASLKKCSTPLGVTDLVTPLPPTSNGAIECSTPLGVTDLVTLDRDVCLSARQVLNASRRHRLGPRRRLTGSASWVLNASRRHRLGHGQPMSGDVVTPVCSTPLGVTRLVTTGLVHSRMLGAQRLSASQTWSPLRP